MSYELERRLGAGGMGEVFLGRRVADGLPVVLKRTHPRAELLERFLHEVRVLARLSHPNIVRVHDFLPLGEGDDFYLVMERVEGEDLARRLERGALALSDFAKVAVGAARALEAAHTLRDPATGRSTPVIHRDVSPHNLLLSEDGTPKLIDFGVASLTGEGESGGKLAYAAPEQLLEDETSPLSDQYSLGVTLWECLTGRRAFDAEEDVEVIRQVTEEGVPRLPAGPFAETVQRMCEREPRARFATTGELVKALEQEARALKLSFSTAAPAVVSASQPSLAPVKPKPQLELGDVERAALAVLREGMTTEEAEAAIDAAGLEGAPFALDVIQALLDAGAISTVDRDGVRVLSRA